jgi:hypothetical protein
MIPILKNTINRIDAQQYTILNLRKIGRIDAHRLRTKLEDAMA